jgi:hypothetical protein
MVVNDKDLYAAVASTLAVAALAQSLRLVSRYMINVPLWYDDYFSIIAFVSLFRTGVRYRCSHDTGICVWLVSCCHNM